MHIHLPLAGVGINLGLKGALRDFFSLLLKDLLAFAALVFLATLEQGQVALCVSTVLLFELNRPAVKPGTMRETILLLELGTDCVQVSLPVEVPRLVFIDE